MRRPRLLAPARFSTAIYHCMSRIVNRDRVFGDREKRQFIKYVRMYSKLFGLNVLTHCLMDNHFHILVEVPRRPEVLPTNRELIGLVRATLGTARADNLSNWFSIWEKHGNQHAIEQERERWFRQMWNLSSFMKVLKQRFSQWFNGTRPERRFGTLWEGRFRSVLVEDGAALQAMAAYIDLNPIRAGRVRDPKDYRWSGYGEAVRGQPEAQAGLRWLAEHAGFSDTGSDRRVATPIPEVLAWYRARLFARGEAVRGADGTVVKRGFSEAEIQTVLKAGGRVTLTAFLRLRIRAFTDGWVLGTTDFVESVFQACRGQFPEKRRQGSRRLARLELSNPLRVARLLPIRVAE